MSRPTGTVDIELHGVTKTFDTPGGGRYTALRDLDLTVGAGEFCAVVGPTGCGKSTTLTLIAGLEAPTTGTVAVHGDPVVGIDDKIGFVFQNDALFPWKSVLDNVMAGPRFRGRGPWTRGPRPATGCAGSGSAASRTATPTSCRGACASGWPWP